MTNWNTVSPVLNDMKNIKRLKKKILMFSKVYSLVAQEVTQVTLALSNFLEIRRN
jgi:hypothetical protein